jgi:membrane-associated phospholipid phosphatase
VYLGAHYLSDVAGGLIMGLVWLSLAPRFVRKGARES